MHILFLSFQRLRRKHIINRVYYAYILIIYHNIEFKKYNALNKILRLLQSVVQQNLTIGVIKHTSDKQCKWKKKDK